MTARYQPLRGAAAVGIQMRSDQAGETLPSLQYQLFGLRYLPVQGHSALRDALTKGHLHDEEDRVSGRRVLWTLVGAGVLTGSGVVATFAYAVGKSSLVAAQNRGDVLPPLPAARRVRGSSKPGARLAAAGGRARIPESRPPVLHSSYRRPGQPA